METKGKLYKTKYLLFFAAIFMVIGCANPSNSNTASDNSGTDLLTIDGFTLTLSNSGQKSLAAFEKAPSGSTYAIDIPYSADEQLTKIAVETSRLAGSIEYTWNDQGVISAIPEAENHDFSPLALSLAEETNTLIVKATALNGDAYESLEFRINRAPASSSNASVNGIILTLSNAGSKSLANDDFTETAQDGRYELVVPLLAGGEKLTALTVVTDELVSTATYNLNNTSAIPATVSSKTITVSSLNLDLEEGINELEIIITALDGTTTKTIVFEIDLTKKHTDTVSSVNFEMIYVPPTVTGFKLDKRGGVLGTRFPYPETDAVIITQHISKGYWMGETEVTQELWTAIMESNPSNNKTESAALLPVEKVTWLDAIIFCNKLSAAAGLKPVYTIPETGTDTEKGTNAEMDRGKNGYRLPTEMEWLWAAMGAQDPENGHKKEFAGDDFSGANVGDYVWFTGNSDKKTQPVGTKLPNELGLYDISGNVFEWLWDWYEAGSNEAYSAPDGASDYTVETIHGENRRLVGAGSVEYGLQHLRLRDRAQFKATDTPNLTYVGLRVVRK